MTMLMEQPELDQLTVGTEVIYDTGHSRSSLNFRRSKVVKITEKARQITLEDGTAFRRDGRMIHRLWEGGRLYNIKEVEKYEAREVLIAKNVRTTNKLIQAILARGNNNKTYFRFSQEFFDKFEALTAEIEAIVQED